MEDLLTRREVAELFGIHERTVARNEKSWGLHPIPISNRLIKYRKSEVEAYLNQYRDKQSISPRDAEKVIRGLLDTCHFDEETTSDLSKVADLLASLYSREG